MFTIKSLSNNNNEQNNINGEGIQSKFSIHEYQDVYKATSANGNTELIVFLDTLSYLSNKKNDGRYTWWDINPKKIISLQNAVMHKFKQ